MTKVRPLGPRDFDSSLPPELSTRNQVSHFAVNRPAIPALTGLRFFAAFFILFAHSSDWIAQFQNSNVAANLSFVSMYGMPLFYVLSGFVVQYNYRDLFIRKSIARAICEFASARFARLYPLYFLIMLLVIPREPVDPVFVQNSSDAGHLARLLLLHYLTLTQTWWYFTYQKHLVIMLFYPISWSISTEMFFYAVYTVAVFAVISICRRKRGILVGIGYTVLIVGSLGLLRYNLVPLSAWAQQHISVYMPIESGFSDSFYYWLFYLSPYVRIWEFILGCIAAEAFLGMETKAISKTETRWANIALATALLGLSVSGMLYKNLFNIGILNEYIQFFALNFLCAPEIAVVLFCVARYDTAFARFFAKPSLIALGEISYSIYLVHFLILQLFVRPAPELTLYSAIDTIWRIMCGFGLTLLVSYATFNLIEVPARVWLRNLSNRAIARAFD